MQKELLKKYANIEAKLRTLEEERLAFRAQILSDLQKNKLDKVQSDYGSFTVSSRKTWTYSDTVTALAEKLKITKSKEEVKGIAKATINEYLLFNPNKE